MRLRRFRNNYNTMQDRDRIGCCDDDPTNLPNIEDGWILRQDGLTGYCTDVNDCDHTIKVDYQVVNGTRWSSGWAGTNFASIKGFTDHKVGRISTTIRACADLQRKE